MIQKEKMRLYILLASVIFFVAVTQPAFSQSLIAEYDYSKELKLPNADEGDYYVELLRRALVKAANGRPIPQFVRTPAMEQSRALHELREGKLIHVHWAGSDERREKILRPIRIPLDRGLLGYRQFIIHRDSVKKFDQVKSLDDLKKMVACQGLDWPDVKIMRAAGLPVREISGFETLFRQITAKRCDYLPREYLQVKPELQYWGKQYPELTSYSSITLHYPLPFYFFVSRKNEVLAQWIEAGLEAMIEDGEFIGYMKAHVYSAGLFNKSKKNFNKDKQNSKNEMRFFEIPNPIFPSNADNKNARYWFQPSEFSMLIGY